MPPPTGSGSAGQACIARWARSSRPNRLEAHPATLPIEVAGSATVVGKTGRAVLRGTRPVTRSGSWSRGSIASGAASRGEAPQAWWGGRAVRRPAPSFIHLPCHSHSTMCIKRTLPIRAFRACRLARNMMPHGPLFPFRSRLVMGREPPRPADRPRACPGRHAPRAGRMVAGGRLLPGPHADTAPPARPGSSPAGCDHGGDRAGPPLPPVRAGARGGVAGAGRRCARRGKGRGGAWLAAGAAVGGGGLLTPHGVAVVALDGICRHRFHRHRLRSQSG